jgi:chemotaxis response regulator CheB
MPKAAVEMGAVERQVALDAMAQAIIDMMNQPPGT